MAARRRGGGRGGWRPGERAWAWASLERGPHRLVGHVSGQIVLGQRGVDGHVDVGGARLEGRDGEGVLARIIRRAVGRGSGGTPLALAALVRAAFGNSLPPRVEPVEARRALGAPSGRRLRSSLIRVVHVPLDHLPRGECARALLAVGAHGGDEVGLPTRRGGGEEAGMRRRYEEAV